jgi:hypothetical protein
MVDKVLGERFELWENGHFYVFDPSEFDKGSESEFPVFMVDDRVLRINEGLYRSEEGATYLVCGCRDYQERERRFEAGEGYGESRRRNPKFEWTDVATCTHIELIERDFARPLMEKVLEEIAKKGEESNIVIAEFLEGRLTPLFQQVAFEVSGDYWKRQK